MIDAAAIIPAWNESAGVAATVSAVRPLVGRVVVVDDGSGDATAAAAAAAGARVLRLPRRSGKAAAVAAGVAASPNPVLLLLDADLGPSASEAAQLLHPILAGAADMTVAVLPATGRRGGRGYAVGLARTGIRRLTGVSVAAPLSGQRALRREVWQAYRGARGFGLEVALTVDLLRAGYRVLEVPTAMTHRVGGLGWRDSLHRARQMGDIAWSLALRLR
jgi:glycosyltransferase involved in cell wall biosynthesis